MPADAPRILVIRRRYLGDIALLGSFFRNLRLHWPGAHITALVEPAYAPVLLLNPDVDRVLNLSSGAVGWLRLLRGLRAAKFTHVFDQDNNDRTAILTRLTGAPFRATLQLETVARHLPAFYTHTVAVRFDDYHSRSITETYLSLLAAAEVPLVSREIRLLPRPEDLLATRPQANRSSPKILLHPGSRSAFRIWPAENFAAVCDRLQGERRVQVSVVGGPAEQPLVEAICRDAKTAPARIAGTLSVPEFAALASQFDLMLCHDSGPMHLAAAVGTTIVALFGSQNATVWGPVGAQHTVLQAPQPCENCVSPGECIRGDSYRNYCVRRITVEEVFNAVVAKLAAKGLV
ncbi:MAG: glycosyltransferase family 9 protein [Opitutaceae bacterium]